MGSVDPRNGMDPCNVGFERFLSFQGVYPRGFQVVHPSDRRCRSGCFLWRNFLRTFHLTRGCLHCFGREDLLHVAAQLVAGGHPEYGGMLQTGGRAEWGPKSPRSPSHTFLTFNGSRYCRRPRTKSVMSSLGTSGHRDSTIPKLILPGAFGPRGFDN